MCVRIDQRTRTRDLNRLLPGLRLGRCGLAGGERAAGEPLAILRRDDGDALLEHATWGLVGSFLDRPPLRPLLALPFAGLAARPFYNRLLHGRRCLIPAAALVLAGERGVGECRGADPGGRTFLLAGLYDQHPQAGTTCALLSEPAAAPRPLLLGAAAAALWLAPDDEFPGEAFAEALAEAPAIPLAWTTLPPPEPSPQLAFAFV